MELCLVQFRIYVDLPDAENRMKILKIFLSQEHLESEFQFDKLAYATDGYSGSDLKVRVTLKFLKGIWKYGISHTCFLFCLFVCFLVQNLCIAAAYRPVQELLEEEKEVRCL